MELIHVDVTFKYAQVLHASPLAHDVSPNVHLIIMCSPARLGAHACVRY